MEIQLTAKQKEFALAFIGECTPTGYVYPVLTGSDRCCCLDRDSSHAWEGSVNGIQMEVVLAECYAARKHRALPREEQLFITSSVKLDHVKLRSLTVDYKDCVKISYSIGRSPAEELPEVALTRTEQLEATMKTMGLTDIRIADIIQGLRDGTIPSSALTKGLIDDELQDAIEDSLSEQDEEDELAFQESEHTGILQELPELTEPSLSEPTLTEPVSVEPILSGGSVYSALKKDEYRDIFGKMSPLRGEPVQFGDMKNHSPEAEPFKGAASLSPSLKRRKNERQKTSVVKSDSPGGTLNRRRIAQMVSHLDNPDGSARPESGKGIG